MTNSAVYVVSLLLVLVCTPAMASPTARHHKHPNAKQMVHDAIAHGRELFFHGTFGGHKHVNGRPMSCGACHAGDSGSGRWPSLQNAAAIFPRFSSSAHKVITLQIQIQRCVKGGLAGRPPANNSNEMVYLTAYLHSIANGRIIKTGGQIPTSLGTTAVLSGKHVFSTTCFACHGTGAGGAPRFGDKVAWKAHVAKGLPTLYRHALNGFHGRAGHMPAKGGNPGLSDADVKAAVRYMVANSK